MASNITRAPMLQVAGRRYAAQAAAAAAPSQQLPLGPQEVKVTTLPNKLVVASTETNGPTARVAVLYRAGSRYENPSNHGVSHALRICAGLSTLSYSQFLLTRSIQQLGGSLTCTSGREYIMYTLECTRDKLNDGLRYLNAMASKQAFKPWEVDANKMRLQLDMARREPQVRVVDVLHKAAFRTGLGNTLYTPKHMIGSHDPETLQQYVSSLFTTNRAAVAGFGVDEIDLVEAANALVLESGDGPAEVATKYYGGEIRLERSSPLVHIAVGTQGASLKSQKDTIAAALLRQILGGGSNVKYGIAAGSKLNTALAGALEDPFAINALNASYSDAGLFGFVLSASSKSAEKALKTALTTMRSASVTDEDVKRAKAQIGAALHYLDECGEARVEDMGLQALLSGNVASLSESLKVLDSVTTADVNAFAKKVASGKLSLAAMGDLTNTPFLDQL